MTEKKPRVGNYICFRIRDRQVGLMWCEGTLSDTLNASGEGVVVSI